MRCAKCGSENPLGKKFCGDCGAQLGNPCPKCGADNPAEKRFCGECGTALVNPTHANAPNASPTKAGRAQVQVTAETLTIDPLDGERKTVTALFADIKGSMELIEDLDPEDARALVDPAIKLMMEAVHRYGGYVTQSTGDGIFALFGAPVAHEDHPQRALYAALRMQEDLKRHSDKLRERGEPPVSIRIGVNIGEVVVRTIQTGATNSEYTPIGHSTSLASRLQALASPGSIAISGTMRKLVEGYFTLKAMGPARIKGVSEPVDVHEVTGLGPLRTRLQASARRGLSKFVGREGELAQMKRALELAKNGHGQVVAAVGEAGVGKSRLMFEFQAMGQAQCLVLETLSVSHGKASAYLPVIDLLRNYFDIIPEDDTRKRREKITGKILSLDRTLEDTLPYFLTLLEVAESDDQFARMDPETRRRRTLDAIKRLLLRESLHQPLIVIFEDLHWLDDGSRALLNLLADSIGTARILMLVNYRPEFTHNWGNKTYYTQLRLDPLGAESGEAMLQALLDDGRELAALRRLIIEKTDGNPFFMEEIVQALFEQGALLRNGAIKLAKSLGTIQIPSTVQAVLASRIDRLPPEQKDLLQTLAVIGKEFPLRLVREVSGKTDDDLQRMLSELQIAEFIYEQPALSDIGYVFKHALSQQVASGSTLLERRKVLHGRIAQVLEAQFPETLETQPELIAHHYTEAAMGSQAIPYWQRAGERDLQRSANLDAIDHVKKGLDLLGPQPDMLERVSTADEAQRYSLLLVLGKAQRWAGKFLESEETLLSAGEVAKSLGSTESLARAALELSHTAYLAGLSVAPAVRLLEEALEGLGARDSCLSAEILSDLARALGAMGEQQRAMAYAEQAVSMARRFNDPDLVAHSLYGKLSALSGPEHVAERLPIAIEMLELAKAANSLELLSEAHFWRGYCLLESGDVAGADAEFETHRRRSEDVNQPFGLTINTMIRATIALLLGNFPLSERLAQEAFAIGQSAQSPSASGILGLQMFAVRREQGRLKELEAAVRFFVQQEAAASVSRPNLALIYAELGRASEARAEFEHLAQHDFADLPRDALWLGTMTYLADVCTFIQDRARADTLYRILVPFAGHNVVVGIGAACYGSLSRYLGALATTLERWDDAVRHFEDALAMNARMDARPWLAHTQARYATMLLARAEPGDRDKAAPLLEAALATASELGMRALEERIIATLTNAELQ